MKQLDPKAVWLFSLSFLPRFLILSWLLGMFVSPLYVTFLALTPGVLPTPMSNPTGWSAFLYLGGLGGIFLFFLFFIFVGSYVWARLSYKNYKYELTDMGFRKESGVLYKKYITIPYDRIQNVDINRGILARMLGLSDLQIQTAGYSATGGATVEGRLPGLSQEIAEQLRDELIRRAHSTKTQGL